MDLGTGRSICLACTGMASFSNVESIDADLTMKVRSSSTGTGTGN